MASKLVPKGGCCRGLTVFDFPYPEPFLEVFQCRAVLVIFHRRGRYNHRHSLFRFLGRVVTQVIENCGVDGIA